MFHKMDAIIAGAGISGLTAARKLAESGKQVIIVEKSKAIGGHCYDYVNEHGIFVQLYGPHIFHTDKKDIWDFVSRFTEWYPYQHKVGVVIDGKMVPIPFNLNSLHSLFPDKMATRLEEKLLETFPYGNRVPILELNKTNDEDMNYLAEFVYEKIFLNYTIKQWGGKRPEELDSSVTSRVPVVISKDDRYFSDAYQGIPKNGFTKMMKNMVDHPNIHLLLNTDIMDVVELSDQKIIIDDREYKGELIYTGPIDELFDYKYGDLPYRSVKMTFENVKTDGLYQPLAVVNYPNNYNFTRITDLKQFQQEPNNSYSTLLKEYPQEYNRGENRPFYVIDNEYSQKCYSDYKKDVDKITNLTCLGRLGEYRYYDMDDAVEAAMNCVNSLKEK